ncbi:uncharacterized protein [Diadema antillarum]|uniref:uncharacterized protein n=1 Tax=Diadema antillarum TaxID=105358 RepID=UPI003A837100
MSCSDTERSSQLRLSVAQLLADLALPLLVQGSVLHRGSMRCSLIGVLVHLLQDDDLRVQGAAVQCLSRVSAEVYTKLRANSKQELFQGLGEVENVESLLDHVMLDIATSDHIDESTMEQLSCDWPVLLGLQESSVVMVTTKALLEPFEAVFRIMLRWEHGSLPDLLAWDLHPCLLLYVAPYLLTLLSSVDTIVDRIKLLHRWAMEGVEKDESSTPNEAKDKEEEQINASILFHSVAFRQLSAQRSKVAGGKLAGSAAPESFDSWFGTPVKSPQATCSQWPPSDSSTGESLPRNPAYFSLSTLAACLLSSYPKL